MTQRAEDRPGSLHQDMLSYLGLTSGCCTVIERAVERGELPPHTDVELMAALPIALVHQHHVLSGEPADEGLARRIAGKFFSPGGDPRQGRGDRS